MPSVTCNRRLALLTWVTFNRRFALVILGGSVLEVSVKSDSSCRQFRCRSFVWFCMSDNGS